MFVDKNFTRFALSSWHYVAFFVLNQMMFLCNFLWPWLEVCLLLRFCILIKSRKYMSITCFLFYWTQIIDIFYPCPVGTFCQRNIVGNIYMYWNNYIIYKACYSVCNNKSFNLTTIYKHRPKQPANQSAKLNSNNFHITN